MIATLLFQVLGKATDNFEPTCVAGDLLQIRGARVQRFSDCSILLLSHASGLRIVGRRWRCREWSAQVTDTSRFGEAEEKEEFAKRLDLKTDRLLYLNSEAPYGEQIGNRIRYLG